MIDREILPAVEAVRNRVAIEPKIGVVTGSGLGAVADKLIDAVSISCADIPGYPPPSVPGHFGELVIGALSGAPVAVMKGRVHFYEGYPMAEVVKPVRILHALGVQTLILTNAAGGLSPELKQGDITVITDHINLPGMAGNSPLTGLASGMERFVAMANAYNPELVSLAREAAQSLGLSLPEVVYAMVAGPSFETPAELRFLHAAGAGAVGMSTAPEVVMARYLGMRVLAFSCITNMAIAPLDAPIPVHDKMLHEEVMEAGAEIAPRLTALIEEVIKRLGDNA